MADFDYLFMDPRPVQVPAPFLEWLRSVRVREHPGFVMYDDDEEEE